MRFRTHSVIVVHFALMLSRLYAYNVDTCCFLKFFISTELIVDLPSGMSSFVFVAKRAFGLAAWQSVSVAIVAASARQQSVDPPAELGHYDGKHKRMVPNDFM